MPMPKSEKVIRIDNSIEQSKLEALANDSYVALDVTALGPKRLPAHIGADLYTDASVFDAPQLQTLSKIYTDAKNFSAPRLRTLRYIYAPPRRASTCRS
jgi:hypothetical protein